VEISLDSKEVRNCRTRNPNPEEFSIRKGEHGEVSWFSSRVLHALTGIGDEEYLKNIKVLMFMKDNFYKMKGEWEGIEGREPISSFVLRYDKFEFPFHIQGMEYMSFQSERLRDRFARGIIHKLIEEKLAEKLVGKI